MTEAKRHEKNVKLREPGVPGREDRQHGAEKIISAFSRTLESDEANEIRDRPL